MRTSGLIIGLGVIATVAIAQGKPDPLEACYQQPDGAPRLACFNREMQRRQSTGATAAAPAPTAPRATVSVPPAAPAPAAAPAAAPVLSSNKVPEDTVGLQGDALRRKLKEEGRTPEVVQPIVARVVRTVARPHSVDAYVLDNGQTWEPVETLDNLNIRAQDVVTIKPGILGAFFLKTPRSRTVRVHRIL